MAGGNVTIAAIGDYNLDDPVNPEQYFEFSADILRKADIAFCQIECPYSDKGSMGSNGPRGAIQKDLGNLRAVKAVGFDIASMAGNHMMDWGQDAMLDCIQRLRNDGITCIGAGANIDEARKPAILERNGTRIAFLTYCSVAPKGYYAAPGKAGLAPMRAITHYEPFEDDQPGTPCDILTYPVQTDLDALVADVKAVRSKADVVVLSLHWGVHGVPYKIADYQPVVAHAGLDAGADIVLGHHPHMLKGVEIYKGKVIFYSMANFAYNRRPETRADYNNQHDPEWKRRREQAWHEAVQGLAPRDHDADMGHKGHTKSSMIVKIAISDKKIKRVSFIPVQINEKDQPVPLSPSDPRGRAIIEELTVATRKVSMNAKFTADGDEVTVS